MRRLVLFAAIPLALSACRERGFDERYADAEQAMRKTAGEIDEELSARASGGAQPLATASAPPPDVNPGR